MATQRVQAREWADYLAQTAAAIDYDNFKDAIVERQGWTRHDAYCEIWRCMAKNTRDDG